jgi:hypothetical protein
MRKLSILMIPVGLVVLSGCSFELGPQRDQDNSTVNTEMNGMSPEEAYDQFLFTVSGSCEEPSSVSFNPIAIENVIIGDASERTHAEMTIYLHKNGSYSALYSEVRERNCRDSGWCQVETLYENKKLNGRWYVDGSNLILQGIGTATYAGTFNSKHAMLLTFGKDFVSDKVTGKKTRVMKIGTNVGENDASINEYCGIR